MKRISKAFLFALAIGMGMGFLIATRLNFTEQARALDDQLNVTQASYASEFSLEQATMRVAQDVGKAVVSISTERIERMGRPQIRRYYFGLPFGDEGSFGADPFEQFFDDFFGGFPEREHKERGLGSGVVISSDGYILTNEHVVGEADKLTVTLSDGREFKATIKGTDVRSDLAVIKIDSENLPFVVLGDSDEVKIGQWVLAVGNPFAYILDNPEPTVTLGVVSALHRSIGPGLGRDRDYSDLIQTDAAINPGNSGGPLVNLSGQVIGINVAIFSTSGGYQGVGFAIPVNTANRIISRLMSGEKILYGWLGVNIQDIDESLKDYFGLESTEGVLVVKVITDTPAQKAGMKEGDLIIALNGKTIKNSHDLMKYVADTPVGDTVKLELVRNKKAMSVSVKIGERPDRVSVGEKRESEEADSQAWRGLTVQPLSADIMRKYRIQESEGVLVVHVEPGSEADDANMVSGDVILSINQQAVRTIDDYNKITRSLKGDALLKTSRGYIVIKGS